MTNTMAKAVVKPPTYSDNEAECNDFTHLASPSPPPPPPAAPPRRQGWQPPPGWTPPTAETPEWWDNPATTFYMGFTFGMLIFGIPLVAALVMSPLNFATRDSCSGGGGNTTAAELATRLCTLPPAVTSMLHSDNAALLRSTALLHKDNEELQRTLADDNDSKMRHAKSVSLLLLCVVFVLGMTAGYALAADKATQLSREMAKVVARNTQFSHILATSLNALVAAAAPAAPPQSAL